MLLRQSPRRGAPEPASPQPSAEDGQDTVAWMWPATGAFSQVLRSNQQGRGHPRQDRRSGLCLGVGTRRLQRSGPARYGKLVIIKHNQTYLSAYAHNSNLLVKEGQNVARARKSPKSAPPTPPRRSFISRSGAWANRSTRSNSCRTGRRELAPRRAGAPGGLGRGDGAAETPSRAEPGEDCVGSRRPQRRDQLYLHQIGLNRLSRRRRAAFCPACRRRGFLRPAENDRANLRLVVNVAKAYLKPGHAAPGPRRGRQLG